MFNICNETIIDKNAEVESSKYRFLSIIFDAQYTALVYCKTEDEDELLIDNISYPFVLEIAAKSSKLSFNDTVKYDNNSSFYKKIEEHYQKINLIKDNDNLCFYVSYGEKADSDRFIDFKCNEIEITLAESKREIYIGEEFLLKEGKKYCYNLEGKEKTFFINKIISSDTHKTIVYTTDDGCKLNFFLKDYLKECPCGVNKITCDIIRDKEIKSMGICSCELPQVTHNDNLYKLISVMANREKIIKIKLCGQ